MDLSEISRNIQVLWENKPGAVLLLLVGCLVFLFIVVDAWFLKRRRKKRR
jgi:hypothetical protein